MKRLFKAALVAFAIFIYMGSTASEFGDVRRLLLCFAAMGLALVSSVYVVSAYLSWTAG